MMVVLLPPVSMGGWEIVRNQVVCGASIASSFGKISIWTQQDHLLMCVSRDGLSPKGCVPELLEGFRYKLSTGNLRRSNATRPESQGSCPNLSYSCNGWLFVDCVERVRCQK